MLMKNILCQKGFVKKTAEKNPCIFRGKHRGGNFCQQAVLPAPVMMMAGRWSGMRTPGRRMVIYPGRRRRMVIYPGRRRHGTTPEIGSPAGRNRTGTSSPPDPAAMMPVPIIVTGDPYALPPSVTVIGDHNRRRSHHHRSRGRSHHHRSRRRSHHHRGRCHGGTDQPDDLSCQMQTFIMMVSGTEKSSRSQKKQDRKNIFAFTHGKKLLY